MLGPSKPGARATRLLLLPEDEPAASSVSFTLSAGKGRSRLYGDQRSLFEKNSPLVILISCPPTFKVITESPSNCTD